MYMIKVVLKDKKSSRPNKPNTELQQTVLGTKDTIRGTFQVTGCLNVMTLPFFI